MTVTGPVPVEELGITSLHEHIICDCSFSGNDPNKSYTDPELMAEEVGHFLKAGGRTICELSCRGLGQDVSALQRISRQSRVQIVAATGFYRECIYPDYVFSESAEQLAQRLIEDIRHGIEGTGIRPGIIAEIATEFGEPELSAAEEKVFRAAALASQETGLAVSTHCWEGNTAFPQIAALTAAGVKPDRIVIGHLACSANCTLDGVLKIADTGVYLGIDAVGYVFQSSDEAGNVGVKTPGYRVGDWTDDSRADLVKGLIDRGYLRQITISQDMIRVSFLKRHGGHGYDHLLRDFLPRLKERGVTEEAIDVMLKETPKQVLTPAIG